ncbi:uncharacterized protein A1O9_05672 [Exophiala aquamarina CBS 119918]|uniref:Transcription factor domain-containing protein n=1 Tax=Exophiala aquamarina CBS 119918 TaxID=1182545 RepID=A0A072PDB2_9EURO|nr:uncharacterized protein A1O9_05672 [Exophiala aquamarina CBS 119918]KEF57752.1 hypothetical protein A1O9_05672 [Exophiala aquamarina CBS 119918]
MGPPSIKELAPSTVNDTSPLGLAQSVNDETPSMNSPNAPVDGMGAVLLENEEILTFFARLNHISNPWGASLDTAGMAFLNIAHSPLDLQNSQKTQATNALDRFALPTEGKIETLIDNYFSDVGLLFPNLHKPTFLECYAQMKRNGPMNTRKIWLGILNMILAVGALTVMRSDSVLQNRSLEAQEYYERAVSLCDPLVLSGTTLEVGKESTKCLLCSIPWPG